ncbi:MAG: hypothetical protein HC831_27900 [Chloroflexia bacterium]|nr:hypothetical protein [Chloroflexia bacterium]
MKKKWIKEKSKSENLIAAIKNLVYYSKLEVTNSTIESDLSLHSSFPSFQCISDVLHNWLIPNKTLKISPEKLLKVLLPAIVYFEKEDKYVLLMSIENNQIAYIDTAFGWITENLDDFLKKWNGIILIVKKQENSGEENYNKKKREKLLKTISVISLLSITLVFLIELIFKNIHDRALISNYLIVFSAKIIGFGSSIILLKLEFGLNNSVLNRICHSSKKLNCIEVLHSKKAKFFGKYSLAEIGFAYFSATLMYLLLSLLHIEFIFVLFVVSGCATLYSLYLIYYQFFILKKACPFCLITELSIFIEFINLLIIFKEGSSFQQTFNIVAIGLVILFISVYIVNEFKSHLLIKNENSVLKKERNFFSQNHFVIKALLETQPKIVTNIEENEIVLNEKYPENNIILFKLKL